MVILASFDPFLKLLVPVCPETFYDLVHSLIVWLTAIGGQYSSPWNGREVSLLWRFGIGVPMHLRLATSIKNILRFRKLQLLDKGKCPVML